MCQNTDTKTSKAEKLENAFERFNKMKLKNADIDSIGVHIEEVKLGAINIKGIKITLAALTILGLTIFFVIKL